MMTTYSTRKAITLMRLPLKMLCAVVLTISLIWGTLPAARAADGDLDTDFDTDGIVTTPGGHGRAVAVQSDGKIVVAGYSNNGSNDDFAVVRYNSDGSLDTSFDTDGIVTTPIGSSNDYGWAVAVQSDGKIVVAGSSSNGSNDDFAVVRYLAVSSSYSYLPVIFKN
jgi:uncharacterized delta-60 repeat protein